VSRAKDLKIVNESQKIFGLFKWAGFIIALIILFAGVRACVKEKKTETATTHSPPATWRLCWEKPNGHNGISGERRKCVEGTTLRHNRNELVIAYEVPNTGIHGQMALLSHDGVEYRGSWRDTNHTGKENGLYLRFISPRTAQGWNLDHGVKVPVVLTKTN